MTFLDDAKTSCKTTKTCKNVAKDGKILEGNNKLTLAEYRRLKGKYI
jgi:hypothetical protein